MTSFRVMRGLLLRRAVPALFGRNNLGFDELANREKKGRRKQTKKGGRWRAVIVRSSRESHSQAKRSGIKPAWRPKREKYPERFIPRRKAVLRLPDWQNRPTAKSVDSNRRHWRYAWPRASYGCAGTPPRRADQACPRPDPSPSVPLPSLLRREGVVRVPPGRQPGSRMPSQRLQNASTA